MQAYHSLALLPAVLGIANLGARSTAPWRPATTAARSPAKQFSLPVHDLEDWAKAVVVSLPETHIDDHSGIHRPDDDCEMRLGAHATGFRGVPDGLVLEPMNACAVGFPAKSDFADWLAFGDGIKGTTVEAAGVARIWPEHLAGSHSPSNPDHAVELHPLTSLTARGKLYDFAPNVFAGDYHGGVGEETALKIVQETKVEVTRQGDIANIRFFGGRIGNFTVLNVAIDRASITGDGAGSYRMDGDVIVDADSSASVRFVSVAGSPLNDDVGKWKAAGQSTPITMEALVLFSLSPKALLDAANKSDGEPVEVERPLQLILYGPPDSD